VDRGGGRLAGLRRRRIAHYRPIPRGRWAVLRDANGLIQGLLALEVEPETAAPGGRFPTVYPGRSGWIWRASLEEARDARRGQKTAPGSVVVVWVGKGYARLVDHSTDGVGKFCLPARGRPAPWDAGAERVLARVVAEKPRVLIMAPPGRVSCPGCGETIWAGEGYPSAAAVGCHRCGPMAPRLLRPDLFAEEK
jgi:hypothetical protein